MLAVITKAFNSLDTNKDGVLKKEEIIAYCKAIKNPITDAEYKAYMGDITQMTLEEMIVQEKPFMQAVLMMEAADTDKDGKITLDEFKGFMSSCVDGIPEEAMAMAFNMFDTDHDGKIDLAECVKACGKGH